MPGCVFHVSGNDFDPDAFLAESNLRPYRSFRRGEMHRLRKKPSERSGFCVDVSDADGKLKGQVADAIQFLSVYEDELRRLRDFNGVTDLRLDFGIFRRGAAAEFEYLPPELLVRAGQLGVGIELSFYSVDETQEE